MLLKTFKESQKSFLSVSLLYLSFSLTKVRNFHKPWNNPYFILKIYLSFYKDDNVYKKLSTCESILDNSITNTPTDKVSLRVYSHGNLK